MTPPQIICTRCDASWTFARWRAVFVGSADASIAEASWLAIWGGIVDSLPACPKCRPDMLR